MLSIDAQTGEIQIQDFDDLSLMTVDTVSPVVRFSDADGLSRDEQVELNIASGPILLVVYKSPIFLYRFRKIYRLVPPFIPLIKPMSMVVRSSINW